MIPQASLFFELIFFVLGVLYVVLVLSYCGIYLGAVLSGGIMLGTSAFGVYLIRHGILLDVTWTLISEFVVASTMFYLNYKEQYLSLIHI